MIKRNRIKRAILRERRNPVYPGWKFGALTGYDMYLIHQYVTGGCYCACADIDCPTAEGEYTHG